MYLIRLDDAAENMNISNWNKMERLLDKYGIKPLVGVIACNEDAELLKYAFVPQFWESVKAWQLKGWEICMHGYKHVYSTSEGGINPVNARSEFAGLSLDEQKEKIRNGIKIFNSHGLEPKVFFAPSHTFDIDTLAALKAESGIRVISDTIANDIYFWEGFSFIPQQSGSVRKLPFKTVTFCYHPNTMSEKDFEQFEAFIRKYRGRFAGFKDLELKMRKPSALDRFLRYLYFLRRR